MTEIYCECNVHGMQHVDRIEIKTIPRNYGLGIVETIYKLECGCEVINQLPSKGNMF